MHIFLLFASIILWTAEQEDCQEDCGKIKETEQNPVQKPSLSDGGQDVTFLRQQTDNSSSGKTGKIFFFSRSSSSGWHECVENGRRGQDKPNSYFKEIAHTHTHTDLGYHDHKHHQHLCARTVSCWTSWKREEFSKHKLDSGLALHILWSSSKSYKLRTLCVWFVYWLHTTPVFSFQVLSAERHLRCYLASF